MASFKSWRSVSRVCINAFTCERSKGIDISVQNAVAREIKES